MSVKNDRTSSSAGTPTSPANSSQANQARRQSAGVACSLCNAITKAGQHMLRCLHCSDSIHLTCQYKLFKEAGNEVLKNKLDWLAEYINFAALAYRCKACMKIKNETCTQVPMTTSDANSEVSQEIVAVKQLIANLDSKIQTLHNAVNQLGLASHEAPISDGQPRQGHPPSYAAAVSADIVKSAVSEAIREQQKASTDRSSIVVYGFPEEENDNAQLLEMFDFMGARCDVIRHSRIGRSPHQSNKSSTRPIRVELRSASNASIILSRAKHLRYDAYYGGVYINKWLSEDEMNCVKLLRRQCDALNRDLPIDNNGRKRFVVISGKIMQRNSNGRLETYSSNHGDNPVVSHGTSSSSSQRPTQQPKNDQGGSRTAPSTSQQ